MVASSALPSDGDMSGIATALDHRLVIDGIFFRTWAGCPWRIYRNGSGTGVDHAAGQSQGDHFEGHFEGQNDRPVSPETPESRGGSMISAESFESRPSRWAVASRALTRRPPPREDSYEGDREEQTDGFGGAVDGTWMIAPR